MRVLYSPVGRSHCSAIIQVNSCKKNGGNTVSGLYNAYNQRAVDNKNLNIIFYTLDENKYECLII